jgi:prolyl-tRNA editing enzyme YbaK/EbsC (Cys-tRNA(Pro) deacylase)
MENELINYLNNNKLFEKGIVLHEFSESTHTAFDAANLLKCNLSQIIKSIVIIVETEEKNIPMLVIVPGTKKLRQRALRKLLKDELNIVANDSRLATQPEVLEITGFIVGSVPPISLNIPVICDSDIQQETIVYGGGGKTNSILQIPTSLFVNITRPFFGTIAIEK